MGISSNLWLKLEDLLPESSTHQRSVPDSHLLLRYLSSFQCRQQDLGPGLKKVPVLKNAPQKLSGSAASDDRMLCPKRLAFIPAIETRGWTKYAQLYRLFSSTLGVDIKHIALLLWFLSIISWFRWYDIYKKTWKCTYTNDSNIHCRYLQCKQLIRPCCCWTWSFANRPLSVDGPNKSRASNCSHMSRAKPIRDSWGKLPLRTEAEAAEATSAASPSALRIPVSQGNTKMEW